MEKKKLLVFHTEIAPYRVDFFNGLSHCFNMTMCIDKKEIYGSLYKNVENDYDFEYKEVSTTYGIWNTIKNVSIEIKNQTPDIVMVSECGLISLLAVIIRIVCRKKYSIVSIIDDSYDQLLNNRHFSMKHKLAERILIPHFNQVINVDNRVAAEFKKKYNKGIAFPIIRDEKLYRYKLNNSLSKSNHYLAQYNLYGEKIVLYVGRFVKIKNIEFLIRNFLAINRGDIRLIMVGAGEDETYLKSISKSDRILYTGPLSGNDLYAWYNIADVFVLPSLVEPFGAVTNEALMAGCKCLISERAGSSCLIRDGENGFTFNPQNEKDFLEKLIILLNDESWSKKGSGIRPCNMKITFKEEFKKVLTNL